MEKNDNLDRIIFLLDELHELVVLRNTKYNTSLSRNFQCLEVEKTIDKDLGELSYELEMYKRKYKFVNLDELNGLNRLYINYYELSMKFRNQNIGR